MSLSPKPFLDIADFFIKYNIAIKGSFSAGKIWENPARIFCLSPVMSPDEQSEESAVGQNPERILSSEF